MISLHQILHSWTHCAIEEPRPDRAASQDRERLGCLLIRLSVSFVCVASLALATGCRSRSARSSGAEASLVALRDRFELEYVPKTISYLDSPYPSVRIEAAATIARFRCKDALPKLRELVLTEPASTVGMTFAQAISAIGDDGLAPRAWSRDPASEQAAIRIAVSLHNAGTDRALKALERLSRHPSTEVRLAACRALTTYDRKEALAVLRGAVKDELGEESGLFRDCLDVWHRRFGGSTSDMPSVLPRIRKAFLGEPPAILALPNRGPDVEQNLASTMRSGSSAPADRAAAAFWLAWHGVAVSECSAALSRSADELGRTDRPTAEHRKALRSAVAALRIIVVETGDPTAIHGLFSIQLGGTWAKTVGEEQLIALFDRPKDVGRYLGLDEHRSQLARFLGLLERLHGNAKGLADSCEDAIASVAGQDADSSQAREVLREALGRLREPSRRTDTVSGSRVEGGGGP